MLDRTESRIRAFVVELLDRPVEPPPFPGTVESVEYERAVASRHGWRVAAASFAIVLALILLVTVPFGGQDEPPIGDAGVVANLTAAVNAGDIDGAMRWFVPDAVCVAPGLPACADLIGFFIAADATMVLPECSTLVEPYLQCHGYVHTSIHDELGITIDGLVATPNFPPAFIIEEGLIAQLNFSSPFTGQLDLDDQLWAHLLDLDVDFINEEGVPRFSPAIVPSFLEAARSFVEQRDN